MGALRVTTVVLVYTHQPQVRQMANVPSRYTLTYVRILYGRKVGVYMYTYTYIHMLYIWVMYIPTDDSWYILRFYLAQILTRTIVV